jgi:hypothetical protein
VQAGHSCSHGIFLDAQNTTAVRQHQICYSANLFQPIRNRDINVMTTAISANTFHKYCFVLQKCRVF